MGVANVMDLSLGEWVAICRRWDIAHRRDSDVAPPSEAEFDAAVMAVRGVNA